MQLNLPTLVLLVAALAVAGYYRGSARAARLVPAGGARRLPALPAYYGGYVALMILLPALAALLVCLLGQGAVIDRLVLDSLPPSFAGRDQGLLLNSIANLAAGVGADAAEPDLQRAAQLLAG